MPDEARAHGLAVSNDQAPVRLAGKSRLGDARDEQRVGDPREERERERMPPARREVDRAWADLFRLGEMEDDEEHVDDLDADEGRDDAAEAVDDEVVAEQARGADRPVLDAAEGERNQGDDDERVEDDRAQRIAL
jgi:hypothetical protein